MANKINIGNLVTPNGASLIFGSEASNDALSLKTNHTETFNPYTIVIEEEDDGDTLPATQITYDPPADSPLTATTVDAAINELANLTPELNGTINGVSYNGTEDITVYSPYECKTIVASIGSAGWYRVATIPKLSTVQSLQWNLIRGYGANNSESYLISVQYSHFNGSFTQLSSKVNYQGITKVRLLYSNNTPQSSPGYLEFYYNLSGYNPVYSYLHGSRAAEGGIGWTPVYFSAGSIPSGYSAIEFELTTNTMKTNTIEANLTGTATKATQDASGNVITSTYATKTELAGKASTSAATTSANGLMTAAMVTKLNGIATGATANTGTITGVSINGESVATSGVADIPAGTNAVWGVVKLLSSTSSSADSGSGVAATPKAVKSAYDLANAAMPKSGGTFTGAIQYSGTTTISSTTGYYRPIRVSMAAPTSSDGNIGDIWIQYS